MQRVATELHRSLRDHDSITLTSAVLRSSWRYTHLRTGPFMVSTLWKIYRMAERRQIDAVLFSSMVTASLAIPLRFHLQQRGVLTAAIVHGRDVTVDLPFYQYLVPHIFSALDAVLPVSRATGEACVDRGLDERKLYVVPNGVAVHRFTSADANGSARSMLLRRFAEQNIPEQGLLLCSVGRQVKRKGFAWFVSEVMPLLPKDVHYWLAGDGPETDDILAAARKKGVEHRLRLLGRVSETDLELLYAASDLFIMPNIPVAGDMEGFGVVMLEAGLSGLPTIASRLEGITDVIAEGDNGHLVSSGDAWGFSEAVMQYYRNHDHHADAKKRAERYVRHRFSWMAVAERYVEVLDALSSPSKVPEEAVVQS